MSSDRVQRVSFIWATRGRSWGFRFLINAGLADPLAEYERAFADLQDDSTTWQHTPGLGALRFPDPLRRRDTAGRVIPHDFVLFGYMAEKIESVEDGHDRVWPLVAEAYARVWDTRHPPSPAELDLNF